MPPALGAWSLNPAREVPWTDLSNSFNILLSFYLYGVASVPGKGIAIGLS